jgi:fido (protein-threonine AMPylation protein)
MSVYFSEDFTSASARSRRVASREIVPIARGVWTDETTRSPEEVVATHWRAIVGHALPGAVVTDRSGFVLHPISGMLFVSHPSRRALVLPGLTVYPDGRTDHRRADDVPIDAAGRIFGASRTRALIDNAEQRGRPAAVRRRLTTDELHDQVAHIVSSSTPRQLENMLADVAADANSRAAQTIRDYVDAARGTGPAIKTGSRAMTAAQRGEQYDRARVGLFASVAADLQRQHLVQRYVNDAARATFIPFYEAYFSNYIEGSTLTVSEAERVVFDEADVGKPKDAHDIRATWEIVSDVKEMSRVPRDADDFMDMLRERHSVMMAAHPEKLPGRWKNEEVSAGATVFVHPDQVVGTLRAAWEEGAVLTDPFQRATYIMFAVSEVHPFLDGNGRSARVAMNAELVPHNMHRIIVPTVVRNEYVSGLVRTTAGNGPDGLYRVLDRAQQWVAVGEFADLATADRYLRATNATTDAGVAMIEGIHLRILRPGELFELPDVGHHAPDADAAEPSLLDIAAALAKD